MVGGSETTATVMCGVLYGLLSTPDVYNKMVKEIRSAFKSSSEIDLASVSKLEYISYAINEGLRILPPTPGNLRRVTPPGGWTVSGWDVPGDTLVAVDCWPAFHSTANFYQPERFAPERWQPEPPAEFAKDNLKVMQGFSVGPRNCIGKNLALMEMKMVLANLFFHFDVAFMPESVNFTKNLKVWGFYKREEFMVKLTPVTG
jgi:cytochrome P450